MAIEIGVRRAHVALIVAIVLVDATCFAAITPLLPLYVEEHGLSKLGAGVLSSIAACGTVIAALPAGWLAARAGPRVALLAGLSLLVVSSIGFGLSSDIVLLDVARFAQGVGAAASWAGGLVWLIAAADRRRRGSAIGIAVGAAIAGTIAGPAIGAIAIAIGRGPTFCGLGAIALSLAVVVAYTKPPVGGSRLHDGLFTLSLRSLRAGQGAWLVFLPALFFGAIAVLVPLGMSNGGTGYVAIAATFLVAAAVEAVSSFHAGRLTDRRGPLAPLLGGLAACSLVGVALALSESSLGLAVLTIGFSAAVGFMWAPAMALLSYTAERQGLPQGSAMGVISLTFAGGAFVGGLGGSALATETSDAFVYMMLVAAMAWTFATVPANVSEHHPGSTHVRYDRDASRGDRGGGDLPRPPGR